MSQELLPVRWCSPAGPGERKDERVTDAGADQDTRTEHDSLGEVEVPAHALWQAQTQRAVDNFPVSGEPIPAPVVQALARIKAAAATANLALGVIDDDT